MVLKLSLHASPIRTLPIFLLFKILENWSEKPDADSTKAECEKPCQEMRRDV